MNKELKNIMTAINCNKEQFTNMADKAEGKISMSSGSWYADFEIWDKIGLLARYSYNGQLKYSRV